MATAGRLFTTMFLAGLCPAAFLAANGYADEVDAPATVRPAITPDISDAELPASVRHGNFVAVPIPFSNPTMDHGLVGVVAYFHPQSDAQEASQPPSVSGVGAMYTSNESWGVAHYYQKEEELTNDHDTATAYVKHRIFENEQQTGGLAFMAGTGVDPSYLEAGTVTSTFKSWWGNLVYTIPFRDGRITWDLLPGAMVNLDKDNSNETAWGMTYSSRAAFYDIIPQSAIVAEVFGTAGEAYSDPRYRVGVRWESSKLIIAATYSDAFNNSGGAGFEIGFIYLTDPRFCFGGCGR